MIDLIEILHTAIRTRLLAVPELMALIGADRIRSGSIRNEIMPAVVLGTPNIELHGHAARGQVVAGADLVLHIWGAEDEPEQTRQIAGTVLQALLDAPGCDGFTFDQWDRPQLVWVRDPKGAGLHGAVDISCVVRWRNN